jgi:hypothetical protein
MLLPDTRLALSESVADHVAAYAARGGTVAVYPAERRAAILDHAGRHIACTLPRPVPVMRKPA